ncbi:DUF3267 domain-containing protein [Staphylococcus caeli]|uniref:Protein of uncharacterized function (DUF3267) n=1 Tax=Staphylococcus caeli TaxID=2201815 RepID=A0A1D4KYU1_9STAP|nr:DUF3267 domain-containing protein [Staphylococcus caeli]AWM30142.1 hypothetical protein SCC82B_00002 [Staphylococcus caeli]SCS79090.1 Protein of uncharacterised function (DUF3267) [Staphylococcus caeli]SCS98599.1 Protein of uncharacterised function (DUF3267) [Staphylococcus caeli]
MRKIDIIGNDDLMKSLSKYQIALFIIFGSLFFIMVKMSNTIDVFDSTIKNIIVGVGVLIGMFILHELIHGLFFKLFSPENKVHFGVAKGMIYCAIPGGTFTPLTFAISAIAPFMIITTIFIITLYIGILPKVFFVTMATMHGMSCVGDFYWVVKMTQIPKSSKIETTHTGIVITEKV